MPVILDGCTGEIDSLVSFSDPDPVLDWGLVDSGDGLEEVWTEGVCGVMDGGGGPELSPSTGFVLKLDFLLRIAELEKL